jgi:hypothetical protein
MAAMKRYFESCTFEPTLDEGKPIEIKTTAQISFTEPDRGR